IVLPWLGRFTVLTGYLVYPVFQLDLLHVDWKVSKAVAERQYYYVGEFAKTNARPGGSKQLARQVGVLDWVPQWIARENKLHRVMALAMLVAALGLLIHGLMHASRSLRVPPDRFAFGIIMLLCVLYWVLKFPAFRVGWGCGIILVAFGLHGAFAGVRNGQVLRWGTRGL